MKKILDASRLSTLFIALGCLIVSSLLPSCSGDKADVSELLATVPADASAVIAVNVKKLVEKAGCEIDGSKIIPGKEVEQIMKQADDSTSNDIKTLRRLLNGEAGIDPTVAVIFMEGNELYFTGFLADPNKFKQFNEKEFKAQFTESEGISSLGNVALKGNQFWIHASHQNYINVSQVSRFTSLNDKLSFLSNAYADKISTFSKDIEGWANLSSLYNASGMSFQQKAMAGMGLAVLFSDAQDIAFFADFDKGKMVTALNFIDSKGNPAKFNLPTDRIDVGLIKEVSPSSDAIFAMAISPKLVEQLQKDLGDKNVPGLGRLMPALSAIDGTCVVANAPDAFKGMVSTKGDNTSALSDFLSSSLNVTVTKDGKLLRFEKGTVSGKLSADDMASRFKGAMIAAAFSSDKLSSSQFNGLKYKDMVALLTPSEGSMKFEVTITSDNDKENFLLTYIKSGK